MKTPNRILNVLMNGILEHLMKIRLARHLVAHLLGLKGLIRRWIEFYSFVLSS